MFDDVNKEEIASVSEESATESETKVEDSSADPSVDFKAKAEEYKQQLTRQRQLADERLEAIKRLQQSKYERKEDEDESDEGDPRATVRKELESWKREQLTDTIDTELESLTDDPDERELVKLVYENEIKVSGSSKKAIQADLKKALAIANLPKLEAQIRGRVKAEVAKSSAQDTSMSQGAVAGGSGRQPLKPKDAPVPAGQRAFMDFVDRIASRYKR